MKTLLLALFITFSLSANSVEFNMFGDILLRYENETEHPKLKDRERLRAIAHLGAKAKFNERLSLIGRLSTGLKNKQNVPAITLARFDDNKIPDRDVFL